MDFWDHHRYFLNLFASSSTKGVSVGMLKHDSHDKMIDSHKV